MERGQRVGLIGAALIVAAIAFILLQPEDSDDDTEPAPSTTQQTLQGEPTATVPAPEPEPEFDVIRVRGGEPVDGVQEVTVEKGDTVRLEVRSDAAAEVHVHGYDLTARVTPTRSARLRFRATITGRFEVELEERHLHVGRLTVVP